MSDRRVIVVVKRTAYDRFVEDEADPRATLLLRRHDPSVASWRRSHDEHRRTLETVMKALDDFGARGLILRRAHAAFDPADAVLVVAVGGDGTLLAASHSVGATPILGVNSAPSSSVGFFCPTRRTTVRAMLRDALEGRLGSTTLSRMSVSINGRIRANRVLNDALYCHASPAATSRYLLTHRKYREAQKSSGFWVGPAAGSTAAQHSAGGRVLPLGSRKLQLVVREPYAPPGTRYRLQCLLISPGEALYAQSQMQDACMFFDGPYQRVPLSLGDIASFRASDEPLHVLGLARRRAVRKRAAR
jgi:NAD+ kinase